MTSLSDLLDELRPVLTEEDAYRILMAARKEGNLALAATTTSLSEPHPLCSLQDFLEKHMPEPEPLARALQGRRLALPEILLWFLASDLPACWFPTAAQQTLTSMRDLPTSTSPLGIVATFLGVPAPPSPLDTLTLRTLSLATKGLPSGEIEALFAPLHPLLRGSIRDCREFLGPALVADVEKARDVLREVMHA